jgi:hypothetical protein
MIKMEGADQGYIGRREAVLEETHREATGGQASMLPPHAFCHTAPRRRTTPRCCGAPTSLVLCLNIVLAAFAIVSCYHAATKGGALCESILYTILYIVNSSGYQEHGTFPSFRFCISPNPSPLVISRFDDRFLSNTKQHNRSDLDQQSVLSHPNLWYLSPFPRPHSHIGPARITSHPPLARSTPPPRPADGRPKPALQLHRRLLGSSR